MCTKKENKYFLIIYIVFCFSCNQEKQIVSAENPNIIFILADDLGYGDLSSFNENSKIKTKNLDKLSADGVMFTDAHTSSAVCTPTRYGILTGRYNWRSTLKRGVLNGYSQALIPNDRKTIAGFLKDKDYKTAGIGKWHLGWEWANIEEGKEQVDYSKKIQNGPTTLGFDYWYGFNGSLDMAPYVWVENDTPSMVPTKETEHVAKQSWWRKGPTSDDFNHRQVLPEITAKTVSFIEENANKEKPFFLYMPLPAPHTPILPTEEFKGKSGLDNIYGDFVLMVDWVVGEVMKTLESQGISDNTIVVFTSDNGCSPQADFEQLATKNHDPSHVFRGHKADIFEGGHRVPFIVRWPEKVKPFTSDQLVCTTDFFATIADAIDAEVEDNMAEDSYSFLKALNIKSNLPARKSIVHHSVTGAFAFRKNNWKAIFCAGSGGWSFPSPRKDKSVIDTLPKYQLYDLDKDIEEQNNLVATNPELLEIYKNELSSIIKNGRSAPGENQKNDGSQVWKELKWVDKKSN
nr:arylsulfatase [uncultured Allomuricauda sp.]